MINQFNKLEKQYNQKIQSSIEYNVAITIPISDSINKLSFPPPPPPIRNIPKSLNKIFYDSEKNKDSLSTVSLSQTYINTLLNKVRESSIDNYECCKYCGLMSLKKNMKIKKNIYYCKNEINCYERKNQVCIICSKPYSRKIMNIDSAGKIMCKIKCN